MKNIPDSNKASSNLYIPTDEEGNPLLRSPPMGTVFKDLQDLYNYIDPLTVDHGYKLSVLDSRYLPIDSWIEFKCYKGSTRHARSPGDCPFYARADRKLPSDSWTFTIKKPQHNHPRSNTELHYHQPKKTNKSKSQESAPAPDSVIKRPSKPPSLSKKYADHIRRMKNLDHATQTSLLERFEREITLAELAKGATAHSEQEEEAEVEVTKDGAKVEEKMKSSTKSKYGMETKESDSNTPKHEIKLKEQEKSTSKHANPPNHQPRPDKRAEKNPCETPEQTTSVKAQENLRNLKINQDHQSSKPTESSDSTQVKSTESKPCESEVTLSPMLAPSSKISNTITNPTLPFPKLTSPAPIRTEMPTPSPPIGLDLHIKDGSDRPPFSTPPPFEFEEDKFETPNESFPSIPQMHKTTQTELRIEQPQDEKSTRILQIAQVQPPKQKNIEAQLETIQESQKDPNSPASVVKSPSKKRKTRQAPLVTLTQSSARITSGKASQLSLQSDSQGIKPKQCPSAALREARSKKQEELLSENPLTISISGASEDEESFNKQDRLSPSISVTQNSEIQQPIKKKQKLILRLPNPDNTSIDNTNISVPVHSSPSTSLTQPLDMEQQTVKKKRKLILNLPNANNSSIHNANLLVPKLENELMKKSKKNPQIVLLSFDELSDSDGTLLPQFEYQIQSRNCASLPSGLNKYRCSSCVSRKGGFICAFIYIRSWIYEKHTANLVGGPIFESINQTALQTSYRKAEFMIFNELSSHMNELINLRRTVGKALKPVLQRELIEFQKSQSVIFIGRRIDVSTQCDYCATTLIGVAWMCERCGKEACVMCFDIFQTLSNEHGKEKDNQNSAAGHNFHSSWIKRTGRCVKAFGSQHDTSSYFKVSHLAREEILKYLEEIDEVFRQDSINTTPPPSPFPIDDFLHHPPDSESDPYYKVDVNTLESNHMMFDQIWSSGVPLVVTGVQDRMQLPWDPEYLSTTYGEEQCSMLDSNSPHGDTIKTNVGDFFERFKGSNFRDAKAWKLRDWPPEIDMNLKFRELFEDFQKAVPMGESTRRDGLKNLTAHFPMNANIPDIGPKMYIAMQTSDQSGSSGSTGLHMDMSDAVNIQTYARCNQEGIKGCSLWHLYHANDAEKVRKFLYEHHAQQLGISVEEVKSGYDDPIHVTRTYIDVEKREKLRKEYGVKGYEIRQKPGEAVFIPAYTAHQVCNLANCIKVAADFVSPISIEKCMKLKEEFREQLREQPKPWKGDVLQMEQMLL
ncbi:uncharacterized protein MELLADRAFT_108548 [Melampsora larici-populina 98AG31]|uniref:JmjC domain-containing protein n=1 Tax=Melampsora larici-populina (strain 98AG31 / pathotype 3-4-7) TaxID=747676 RepID=F4RTG2_MELLP|nr:uncharacterized protein MELLADRAFT_108548 [Melampsora larici-populina 98AG31]EGG04251.1 hypothetical protein MELLADRAFT_108548 [Melampsora larici-populina 98AG31]